MAIKFVELDSKNKVISVHTSHLSDDYMIVNLKSEDYGFPAGCVKTILDPSIGDFYDESTETFVSLQSLLEMIRGIG
jgi:hypothetical protein